jgi:hypothetical protein
MAALAGSKTSLLRSCCCVMEFDIRLLGRDRRATRPAVDPSCAHSHDERSVESRIAARCCGVAAVVIEWWHVSIMAVVDPIHQRNSDGADRLDSPSVSR